MQANGGGGGDVEGFLAAGLGNAHMQTGHGFEFSTNTLPFVPERPGTGKRQSSLVQCPKQIRTTMQTMSQSAYARSELTCRIEPDLTNLSPDYLIG